MTKKEKDFTYPNYIYEYTPAISRRDLFAAIFLQGLVTSGGDELIYSPIPVCAIVERSIEFADLLCKKLDETKKTEETKI